MTPPFIADDAELVADLPAYEPLCADPICLQSGGTRCDYWLCPGRLDEIQKTLDHERTQPSDTLRGTFSGAELIFHSTGVTDQ